MQQTRAQHANTQSLMMKTQRTQVLTLMRKRGTELGLVWIDLSTLHPQLHQFWRSPHQNQNEKTELSVLWDSSSTDTKASSTKCHWQSGQTATGGDLTAKESGGQGPQSQTEHGERALNSLRGRQYNCDTGSPLPATGSAPLVENNIYWKLKGTSRLTTASRPAVTDSASQI